MVNKHKNSLIMLCASLSLCACSTAKVSSGTIPEQGLTVSQLYQHSSLSTSRGLTTGSRSLAASMDPVVKPRDVAGVGAGFKALPNPEIPIHIFAHVANIGDEQIIKPAYTTRFFLYKQNQYALASELY